MSEFFWRVAESTASAIFVGLIYTALKSYWDIKKLKSDMNAAFRKLREAENERNNIKNTNQDCSGASHRELD